MRQNRADLAHRGGEAVAGGPVARGEALAGDDEGGGVGAPVEEELGDNVERQEGRGGEAGAGEAEDEEEEGEDGEADDLDGLAAEGVDCQNGGPVAGETAGAGEDDHADGVVVEGVVEGWAAGVVDCGQDDGVV